MTGNLINVRCVLVETSHPGNIGGAARALKTMGLSDLRLVRPRRFPDPQADWRAAGGLDVVERARVVDTLDDAIDDCVLVVGTSNRARRIPWPVLDAPEAAERMVAAAESGPVAILFGREADGLNNAELQACHLHLAIAADPDYPSLNLAMAVQVVAYEVACAARRALGHTPSDDAMAAWDRPLATHRQQEAAIVHLQSVLRRIGFLDGTQGQTMTRLRRLLARTDLDETEVQMLRGALSAIDRVVDAGERPGRG